MIDAALINSIIEDMLATNASVETVAAVVKRLTSTAGGEADAAAERRARNAARMHTRRTMLGLSEGEWLALRALVFECDGLECVYCGSTNEPTVDHVVPLCRGGTNHPDNLCVACKPCNSSKGHRLISEWKGRAQ